MNKTAVLLAVGMLAIGASVRASTPGVWTDAGAMSSVRAEHTATLLASGQVLVTGDISATASADLYDAASNHWTPASAMHTARDAASASLLANGSVLVAGGNAAGNCVTTVFPSQTNVQCYAMTGAELYAPAGNVWSGAASLTSARQGHTATVLASGKVLVAGGASDCTTVTTPTVQYTTCNYNSSAELYDPSSNSWSPAGTLGTPRMLHKATLLASVKVLLSGGSDNNGVIANAEIYDPATNAWSPAASPATPRASHTATLLPSGKVFVAGGTGSGGSAIALSSTEIYDPVANSWSAGAALSVARNGHSATLLTSGKVLLAGGGDGVDLYTPSSNTLVQASPLTTSRALHTATLLANGKVVVAGGFGNSGELASAELFDPSSATYAVTATAGANGMVSPPEQTVAAGGTVSVVVTPGYAASTLSVQGDTCTLTEQADGQTWTTAAITADCAVTANFLGPMSVARNGFTATLLANGKVLVAGGSAGTQADLFDPQTDTWSSGGTMGSPRYSHSATLLASGEVLVAGGTTDFEAGSTLMSCEIYNPANNAWSPAGNMLTARSGQAAALLPNGRVLVAGSANGGPTGHAELFNPTSNSWSAAASPSYDRASPVLAVLHSGSVLLLGGGSPTTQLYNPTTNTWSAGGNQPVMNSFQTASVLQSGKVLAVGGEGTGATSSAATTLYDPTSNTWSAGPNLHDARSFHTQTVLSSGKVIVLGGDDFSQAGYAVLASAEEYDPSTNAWSTVASLATMRAGHTATLLGTGQILVAGGDTLGTPSAELYGAVLANEIFKSGFETP